jgi:hypothetical protein
VTSNAATRTPLHKTSTKRRQGRNLTDRTHVVAHDVHRLQIPIDLTYEEFRRRYEQAVPVFDLNRYAALDPDIDRATVRAMTDDDAPHGLCSSDPGCARLAC